jgi:hypothetical protein
MSAVWVDEYVDSHLLGTDEFGRAMGTGTARHIEVRSNPRVSK